MVNKETIFDEITRETSQLNAKKYQIWMDQILFDWHWWLNLIFVILFIVLWIKFRKKESTDRLLYTGFFIAIFASFLDLIGSFFGLWDYHYELFPAIPCFLPWDVIYIPITIMFFLQIKPKMNPLLKGMIYAGVTSFIGLPILNWLGYYKPINWNFFYSFLIQNVLYLVANYISTRNRFSRL